MKAFRRHILAMTATVLLVFGANAFNAEAAGKSAIKGAAVDASGGALPGVTVVLKAAAGSAAEPQEQVTDGEGHFTFEDLDPGTYAVVLSLSGFEEKKFDAVTVPAEHELKAVLQIAALVETVIVRATDDRMPIPVNPIGETVMEQAVLSTVPLATERFDDALPLLPGIVRGPDGLLNMNGARADQSSFLMNGVSMTDPVTGHFAVRLPIEAIETMNVHAGVYSAAYGNATGGVTDVVIRPGLDKLDVQVQNFMPRIRFQEGGIRGIDSFTPRLRVSGPIDTGRIWFSQASSYRFVRSRVDELEPLNQSEQKVNAFDSVTQIDALINSANHFTGTFVVFPSNIDNAGIDTLHPFDATPDLKQRGWTAAVSERAVLADNRTLSSSFSVKRYDMNVAPKYDDVSLITVSGTRQNYFNHFDRQSTRYEGGSTLAIALPDAWGQHLLRTGGQFAHTSYDGIDESRPVIVARADGSTLRRIDYVGSPVVGATNTEVAGFIEDQWAVASRVTIHGGARYAYEQIAGGQTIAPRVDASIRPFENGRTVVKAGIGQLYDKLPLNAADFEQHQARRITEYDAQGAVTSVTTVANRFASDGLRTPNSTTWNVELDQVIAPNLQARVGYRHTSGANQLVVDPQTDDTLRLSSTGQTRSHEIEATVRRQFKNNSQITASYVHSSARGDLNDFVSLFGDMRDPMIRPNEYTRQSFDVPNRFLVWGVLNLPHAIAVAPTMEYRSGFPYTVIDEQQNVVGTRNEGARYPNLFTLDLSVTKDVQLTKKRRARIGVQLFNLTNHLNPQDVQNNTASPTYGQFANSVDRQVRTKFTFLF
jgi:carboxypeptidase family protein/TonB-dependent receptor-like protein